MSKIKAFEALEILDSRGMPTIKCSCILESGHMGAFCTPSGASTGIHEAIELRDGDVTRFKGRGVLKAIGFIHGPIQEALIGQDALDQRKIDELLIELDGTANKERFGANAILAVSGAVAHAAASFKGVELYEHLAQGAAHLLPSPMMNVINGGAHADNNIDFQEFMIRPIGASSFKEALRWGAEIFMTLKTILQRRGLNTAVGDEGGFAPDLASNEEALDLLIEAIKEAGFEPGKDVTIALDCAASFFFENGHYLIGKKAGSKESRSSQEQVNYLHHLTKTYPIDSIEDGLEEEEWEGWRHMTQVMGRELQLVGDDLFVTNEKFLKKGIKEGIANAILIKPNQIGTITETIDTVKLAKKHGYKVVISHRSGETEDTTIADLAVALESGQIKTGSLSRSERTSKYNRLLQIEHNLGPNARFQ